MEVQQQAVKGEAFSQTGRRGTDVQPWQTGCAARWWLEDWVVPRLLVGKLGGTTGE